MPQDTPGRFYVEIEYTFSEEDTAVILRNNRTSMEDQVVLFETSTGILAAVTVTHIEQGLGEALVDALDYARWELERTTRETWVTIPEPWVVKIVDGEGLEFMAASRQEIAVEDGPEEPLVGVGAAE